MPWRFFIEGQGGLKKGRAVGGYGLTAEALAALPLQMMMMIWRMIVEMMAGDRGDSPGVWELRSRL